MLYEKGINIGIIGCGEVAKKHIEGLKNIPHVNISSIYDVNKEKAERLGEEFQVPVMEKKEECMEISDVVYILTPPSFHREIALEALSKKKHIFIEKPIAVNIEDAEEIVRYAELNGVKTMVGFNMRFRKSFMTLKEKLNSNQLGKLQSIWSHRIGNLGSNPNWRTTQGQVCGMTIESLSHDIDIIRWLAGDISNVKANIFSSQENNPDFDDNASIILDLENGGTATILASWSSHIGYNSRGIIGTEGTALLLGNNYWDFEEIRFKNNNMEIEENRPFKDVLDLSSYQKESEYFVNCILNNKDPETNVQYGLSILKICHKVLQASENTSSRSLNLN